jgi:hypothetical protein
MLERAQSNFYRRNPDEQSMIVIKMYGGLAGIMTVCAGIGSHNGLSAGLGVAAAVVSAIDLGRDLLRKPIRK